MNGIFGAKVNGLVWERAPPLIGAILLWKSNSFLFLGAGAPLGLSKLVRCHSHKKVSKSNNLLSLASTSILILVTCYLKPDTYYLILVTLHLLQVHVTWYFHLLFVTLFLLNLIHLTLYLLPSTCFLIIFTWYILPNICYLILIA